MKVLLKPIEEELGLKTALVDTKQLALLAVAAASGKNALVPVLLDVSRLSSYADLILILSGRPIRQIEAISEAIQRGLKETGCDPLGVEGERGDQWLLLDYGSLVIHIFYHPLRDYYDLEGIWSDAPTIQLEYPQELRSVQMYV